MIWTIARAHRLSDAAAADVAQTTWLRVVEHLEQVREPGRLGGWIATTARRECLRALRAATREVPADEDVFEREPDETAIDPGLLIVERDAALWRAFNRLPVRD